MSDNAFSDMLIHSCTIYRRALDSDHLDKWGDSAETITVSSSSVPCLFQSRNEYLEFSLRGEKVMSKEMVFFEFTANLEEDDILIYNSKKYLVLGIDNAAGQGHHKECSVIPLTN
jgi:hypothetical protein